MSPIASRIVGNCSLVKLKDPAFRIIHSLQDNPDKAAQVEALFLVTAIAAAALGICPHEMLARARRQMAEAEAVRNPHLEAIRDYAEGELR